MREIEVKRLNKFSWRLAIILALLLAVAGITSCTCEHEQKEWKDDDNIFDDDVIDDDTVDDDDDTEDDDNDDDDTDNDDVDDDAEGWSIYTVDTDAWGSSIALDTDNNVHIGYIGGYGDLKYATNKTGPWQIFTLDNPPGWVGDRTSISLDLNGKVHIAYIDKISSLLKYATNKSGSWQIFTITNVGDVPPLQGNCSIDLDSNNKVYIAFQYCPPPSSFCEARYATNKSGSWQIYTIEDKSIFPSLALDSNDKIHVLYLKPSYELKYATNATGSWKKYLLDNSVDDLDFYSDIAVDSNNKPHISYYKFGCCLNYATNISGYWQIFAIDPEGYGTGIHNSIALDSNNSVHISYMDATDDDLKYATNKSGTWEIIGIDSEGSVGSFTSIAIDSDDYVHISYAGVGSDGTLALKYATNRPPE